MLFKRVLASSRYFTLIAVPTLYLKVKGKP